MKQYYSQVKDRGFYISYLRHFTVFLISILYKY